MDELRDFFNAASLTTIIDKIAEQMGPEDKQVIGTFMGQKAALDSKGSAGEGKGPCLKAGGLFGRWGALGVGGRGVRTGMQAEGEGLGKDRKRAQQVWE